jgi:hypothetical protein
LLLAGTCPFDVSHRNLAERTAPQCVDELLGRDRENVALALQSQFVVIHRVRDIDGEHEFDINRRPLVGGIRRRTRKHRERHDDRPARQVPNHHSPSVTA